MMNWIKSYQLFLFDFDGLLVNTEELHYQAYIRMCKNHGIDLKWDFLFYANLAHRSATGVREQLYKEFPNLKDIEWDVLYSEKKHAISQLLKEGAAHLMPGVEEILLSLKNHNIKRCVVTHSPINLIQIIREQNPILNTIPNWITREDYAIPKPDPECYKVAISRYAVNGDRVIGFEDSPRGLQALMGTNSTAVLICPEHYPYVEQVKKEKVIYYPSFTSISDVNAP